MAAAAPGSDFLKDLFKPSKGVNPILSYLDRPEELRKFLDAEFAKHALTSGATNITFKQHCAAAKEEACKTRNYTAVGLLNEFIRKLDGSHKAKSLNARLALLYGAPKPGEDGTKQAEPTP